MTSFFLSLVAICLAGAVQALTLDFEGIAPDGGAIGFDNSGFSTNGFEFLLDYGQIQDSNNCPTCYQTDNGTDWLLHMSKGVMTMTSTVGAFSLHSIDYGDYEKNPLYNAYTQVTGHRVGGGTVTREISSETDFRTIDFGWTNLASVSFDTFDRSYYTRNAYDNFVVSLGTVPLPASLPLMLLALGGAGLALRRRAR
ncbi:PEP-CTERM sorting domain-containing protein [Salipiger mucosus]|uniref:Ice-binding protein C-terminal domain-containing protein n=1 Tax=Salipiger mucosus DSM 16094 TaxID=1123237 RepID=S9Q853_9RHOB|nr:PEP-CTERM sorting domain-containing protein [Salipiger mucosus]EPX75798.1 hypothetical protein Salmuc_05310 [Salipiger mucosus DSM 16094]